MQAMQAHTSMCQIASRDNNLYWFIDTIITQKARFVDNKQMIIMWNSSMGGNKHLNRWNSLCPRILLWGSLGKPVFMYVLYF